MGYLLSQSQMAVENDLQSSAITGAYIKEIDPRLFILLDNLSKLENETRSLESLLKAKNFSDFQIKKKELAERLRALSVKDADSLSYSAQSGNETTSRDKAVTALIRYLAGIAALQQSYSEMAQEGTWNPQNSEYLRAEDLLTETKNLFAVFDENPSTEQKVDD